MNLCNVQKSLHTKRKAQQFLPGYFYITVSIKRINYHRKPNEYIFLKSHLLNHTWNHVLEISKNKYGIVRGLCRAQDSVQYDKIKSTDSFLFVPSRHYSIFNFTRNNTKDDSTKEEIERNTDIKRNLEGSSKYCDNEHEETIQSYVQFLIEKCKSQSNVYVDEYGNPWYVEWIFELLSVTKQMLGCSWMSSIIMVTFLMRLIILPLSIASERDRRKQTIVNPIIKEYTNELKRLMEEGNFKKATEYKKRILNIRNTHGISLIPKSIFVMALFQTPLFCIFYFSMKQISSHPEVFKEFTLESPLWLDSLSLPDPLCILPFLSSLVLLSNHELTQLIDKKMEAQKKKQVEETDLQKSMKKFTKVGIKLFYIGSVFFFKSMPSGLFIYFITNTFIQFVTTQMCKITAVERFLDLPPLNSKDFTSFEKNKDVTKSKKTILHMNDLLHINNNNVKC